MKCKQPTTPLTPITQSIFVPPHQHPLYSTHPRTLTVCASVCTKSPPDFPILPYVYHLSTSPPYTSSYLPFPPASVYTTIPTPLQSPPPIFTHTHTTPTPHIPAHLTPTPHTPPTLRSSTSTSMMPSTTTSTARTPPLWPMS